jgi:hypothetical protein
VTVTNDTTEKRLQDTDCHVCGRTMKRFAQDYWYWYYRCACGCERLIPKEENERGYQPWPGKEAPAA